MTEKNTEDKKPRIVKGSSLIPDLSSPAGAKYADSKYWMGALPSLPSNVAHVAGMTFAHTMSILTQGADGQMVGTPGIGVLRQLFVDQLEKLQEALPYLVVRFHNQKIPVGADMVRGATDISGPKNTDPTENPENWFRPGHIIRIPRPEQEAILREAGRFHPFIPGPNDEPLAAHIYCVKAEQRGSAFPPSLAETGLEF